MAPAGAQVAPAEAQVAPASPVAVTGTATVEAWSNRRGGLRKATAILTNLEGGIDVDAEAAFGLAGTTFHASLLHNNRTTFSGPIVGDVQTVSNIDTDGSLRLYEVWIARRFDRFSVKAGLIDLNSEFDVSETAGLFINSSFGIGPDFSQAGDNGPSVFPVTGLGIVGRIDLADRLEFRAGLFEGTPGHRHAPRRMRIHLGDEGALFVAEGGYRFGDDGRVSAGGWRLTENVDRIEGGRTGSSGGFYISAEGTIVEMDRHRLAAFARIGFADGGVYPVARYQGAGLTLAGPILGGRGEQVGIAVASAESSSAYRRVAPSMLGVRRETAIELTYRKPLTRFLSVQPDVQYIVNPGMDPSVRDALAIGFRVTLAWPGETP